MTPRINAVHVLCKRLDVFSTQKILRLRTDNHTFTCILRGLSTGLDNLL
jgi:hypothetical protein